MSGAQQCIKASALQDRSIGLSIFLFFSIKMQRRNFNEKQEVQESVLSSTSSFYP